MGSIDKACISGFLCRLCSEMHRIVIHIYGDQGKRLSLVEKINGYLPITISPTDPLPKTICENCLRRVEQHYDLLVRLSRIKESRFMKINKTQRDTLNSEDFSDMSEDDPYNSDYEPHTQSAEPTRGASTSSSAIPASTSSETISNTSSSSVEPSSTLASLHVVSTRNPPEYDVQHND